ncbi:MFS domain-containing protein [Mycena sanguinolenta]|uniref:MFS domain-containing protein n=1 Tax=Mycena sanguinolenta TaxID=230812 RepID=A0A8H6XFK8_9AGAR|nr:MFS domain-containing protein [Mycena sanguinolenta]
MSLQPTAVELCQSSALRGRRRSSIRPQNLLPLLFTSGGPPSNENESAIEDDAIPPEYPSKDSDSAPPSNVISPVTHAHVSGHSSSFSTSRHQDALSMHKSELAVSPSGSASAVSSDSYFERKSMSKKDLRLKYRLASVIFLYFLNGWGDGVTGTALTYFEAEFHLSYMVSSLLFVATTCGFVSGTFLVTRGMNFLGLFYLADHKLAFFPTSPWRIAFSRPSRNTVGHSPSQARYLMLIIASLGSPTAFVLMGLKIGFPAMFVAYICIAFARAFLTASLNVFLAERPFKCMGYAYGFGAVVSPLIFQATAAAGLPWAHFYFGSLVSGSPDLLGFVFLSITFYPTALEFEMDRKNALSDSSTCRSSPSTPYSDDVPDVSVANLIPPAAPPPVVTLRLISAMPYQWAITLFSLLYCGTETTTQGLVVQYLLAERGADPKTVGYTTSGFWAGITISRVSWSYFSSRISFTGRKYIIQCTLGPRQSASVAGFLTQGTSLIGLFFGPVFPACLELANDILPAEVSMISMAIISAGGSLGNAIFPFATGVITTEFSMRAWPHMTVAQVAVLFCSWYLFPTRQPSARAVAL